MLIASVGVIGYLIVSAIKGDLQLKDRGTMVLGRGGVLNRIDSLIFTGPLFFHFMFFVYATGL
jgi:phosphatidate cytidylyltransferase